MGCTSEETAEPVPLPEVRYVQRWEEHVRHVRVVAGFVVGLLIAVSIGLATAPAGFAWQLIAVAAGTFIGAAISGKYATWIGLTVPIVILLAVQMVLAAIMRHAGLTDRGLTPTAVRMSVAMLLDGVLMASVGKLAHDRWQAASQKSRDEA